MKLISLSLLLVLFSGGVIRAQQLTQTVRGTVHDKISGQPIPGVVVIVKNTEPVIGSVTDLDGLFRLDQVPVGKQTIVAHYTGYHEVVFSDLQVNSGKEVVLTIEMEEDISQIQAVEIVEERDVREPMNSMTTVSTRTFSVEETRKFAAAINDPSRTATSFAGVITTDDGNNHISVRGNSPAGLLWRMEGVDIPNPNHFANAGSSGGGISIISSQLLSNSDFMTGAFAAEYGNALSGVFDLRLRKGNNERREYTLQAGFLGLDAAAEGPLKQGYAGSYLVNYRLSTLTILQNIGLNLGDVPTNFQDLSYNVYLPTERFGAFTLFGFGGLSNQKYEAERDSSEWPIGYRDEDWRFASNTGMSGLKHTLNLGPNTYLQSSLVYSFHQLSYKEEELGAAFSPELQHYAEFANARFNWNEVLNHKFNARHSLRTGVYLNHYTSDIVQDQRHDGVLVRDLNHHGSMYTAQGFAQWRFRVNDQLTLNSGVHALYIGLNGTGSVEPRLGLKYALDDRQSLSFGYGLHSQMQAVGTYTARVADEQGNLTEPNRNLGLNKSHHVVVGYERSLRERMYMRTEVYYQHLFNIAVYDSPDQPSSVINHEQGYITERLTNQGRGRNYGVELTLEQFTFNNLYFLLSGSLFQSEYTALDGEWRNTRFNTNYSVVFTGGKEWKVGRDEKMKTLGVNLRTTFVGGMWTSPIDLEASREQGSTVVLDQDPYTRRMGNYFRPDVRISLRRQFRHMTTTLALDLQNATNTKSEYGSYFDPKTQSIRTYYNLPLIPVLSYRMEF